MRNGGGHFELESGGHFKLELGGQYHWNLQKGYVSAIFSNYYELIKTSIDNIDKKIKKENIKIGWSNDEMIQNVNELRSLYVAKFYENILLNNDKNIQNIEINNTQLPIRKLLEDSNFELFRKIKNISFSTYNRYHGAHLSEKSGISFENLESEIGSYIDRLEIIENKKIIKINEFKKEIETLENEKQIIRTKKVKDLVNEEYLQRCLDNLEVKESINVKEIIDGKEIIITKENTIYYKIQNIELINYLIRYGHIDDSYSHYISYFYPGTITKEDNDFLKSFTNNNPLPYDFKLKEIESLFPDILESDFSREEILNFSLLDYILERNNTEKQLSQIIALLSTKIQKPTNFIDEYITYTVDANKKSFLQAVCKYWKNPNQNIWEEIVSNFSDDKCIYYLNLMFSTLDFETIKALNFRTNLTNYISEIESLTSFSNIDTEITAFILETNLKFKNINNEGSKVLFDFIYQKNSYEINEKMIELFTSHYSQNKFDLELLKTANYTTIKNSGASKLINYIDSNIEFYIKTIFLKLENNHNESEEIIIKLLNDNYEDFGPELIIEIINKNQTPIQDISKITYSELWATLLQVGKIAVSWDNLLYYFKEKQIFDDILVNYLNIDEHYSKLSKVKINKDFDKVDTDFANKFAKELIKSKISLITFSTLNYSFPYSYPDASFEFKDISNEKIKVLIQKRTILLSLKNYTFISEKFTDLLLVYLEINSNKFIDEVGNYELDSSIISKLIDSRVFTPEQKMLVMDHIPETVFMANKEVSNKMCNLLANNRKIDISIDLLRDLLTQSQSIKDKIRLFNIYQGDIPNSELKSIIQLLGSKYFQITEGKNPKFENNEDNLEFIKHRKKDFITKTNFEDNGKSVRVFTKRKTK